MTSRSCAARANSRWAARLSGSIVATNRRTPRSRAASASASASARPEAVVLQVVGDDERDLGDVRVVRRRIQRPTPTSTSGSSGRTATNATWSRKSTSVR